VNLQSSPQPSGRAQLECKWERFTDIASELAVLSARQQAEIGEGYEPYNPDWNRYFAFERAGSCAVWAARSLSGTLVGYVIWLTVRGLHNVTTKFATADLIYLAPEWRGGLLGYKFLRSSIDAVKALEPDLVRVETNDLYAAGRVGILLKRLGFRRIGSVWQR